MKHPEAFGKEAAATCTCDHKVVGHPIAATSRKAARKARQRGKRPGYKARNRKRRKQRGKRPDYKARNRKRGKQRGKRGSAETETESAESELESAESELEMPPRRCC